MKCKYKPDTMMYNSLKDDVIIPKFQRGLVWSKNMKKDLIETIRLGYPFGTLLLFEQRNGDKSQFQLVDGLQRFTTLRDYENNKFDYIEIDNYAEDEINAIITISARDGYEIPPKLRNEMKSFLINSFKSHSTENINNISICTEFCQKFSIDNIGIYSEIAKQLEIIIKKIDKEIDLNTLKIPIVIFNGERDELPDIYDKINSHGTKLSKYEIFAAVWHDNVYELDDDEILSKVDQKYEDIIETTGVTVSNYENGSILETKKINLFEYAYAIGKLIRDKCPKLFAGAATDISTIDSIGFALLTVCVNGSIKKMNTLPTFFNNTNEANMINLKEKIISCTILTNDILINYINTIDGKNTTKYIESQIVSIIGTFFHIKYYIDNTLNILPRDGSMRLERKFRKFMPKHYLYDIIKDYWAGSGDTKIQDLLSTEINKNKYLEDISDDNWRAVLWEWASNQEKKVSKNVVIKNKLFLNYILQLSVSRAKYANIKFDIEHIVPMARLTSQFTNGSFSALGNLCYFPQLENRQKKDLTLFEYNDCQSTLTKIDKQTLEDFSYAERGELEFIKQRNTFTEDGYQKFLHDRHNYLIEKFIELIKKI